MISFIHFFNIINFLLHLGWSNICNKSLKTRLHFNGYTELIYSWPFCPPPKKKWTIFFNFPNQCFGSASFWCGSADPLPDPNTKNCDPKWGWQEWQILKFTKIFEQSSTKSQKNHVTNHTKPTHSAHTKPNHASHTKPNHSAHAKPNHSAKSNHHDTSPSAAKVLFFFVMTACIAQTSSDSSFMIYPVAKTDSERRWKKDFFKNPPRFHRDCER